MEEGKFFYGCKPSLKDIINDNHYAIAPGPQVTYLDHFTLADQMSPCYDQGELGSCVDNAIAGNVEYVAKVRGLGAFMPSRLFMYYNARAFEKTTDSDSGSSIRDGIKGFNTWGAPPESECPYDISTFTIKPSPQCYKDAILHKSLGTLLVKQDLESFFHCMQVAKRPVVIGFTVYKSFESKKVAKTGIVPMPGLFDYAVGGHGVLIVGFDQKKKLFHMRNSWGPGWGLKGYCWIPFDYIMNPDLSWDFWSVDVIK